MTNLAHADFQDGWDAYNRKDYTTAFNEWLPLATQGHADAQNLLGTLYSEGQGVPQDDGQAREWWLKAAAQGHADARVSMGTLYETGQGVPQDYGEACRWYRLAAEEGSMMAKFMLGCLYGTGQGVPKDRIQAHMWLNLAAGHDLGVGGAERDLIAERMTPEQIAEAQRLAREWLAQQHQK